MNFAEQLHGQVISFSRGSGLRAVTCFLLGFLLLAVGALIAVLAVLNSEVGRRQDTLIIGMPALGMISAAALSYWKCWDSLTRKPRLVLGDDRMQWVEGKRVHWEVHYEHVAAIELFNGPLGAKAIGIRLHLPESLEARMTRLPWKWRLWQAQWKRFGFDIVLPPRQSTEPVERVLETALTCLHRYVM